PAVLVCQPGRGRRVFDRWSFLGGAAHGVDGLSEGVQGVVGAGFHGAGGYAEGGGGLGDRGVAEIAFEQHLAVLGGQGPQRVVHEVPVDGLLRGVRDWLFGNPVGGYFGAAAGRPPLVDDDAFGDGEQPAPRGTAGLVEPGEVAHGAKEDSCTTSWALPWSPPVSPTA